MTDWDAEAGARRVLCPAEIHLTAAEQNQLENLPHASTEVPWTLDCALEAGHDEDHHVEGQSAEHLEEDGQPGDIWWVRWNDQGRREIVVLLPCPVTQSGANQPDRDLCLLFEGHPGRHGFLPGREIDHLAEYIDYSHRAIALAAQDPAAAQVTATLALASAINRLADAHSYPADNAATSTVISAAMNAGQSVGV